MIWVLTLFLASFFGGDPDGVGTDFNPDPQGQIQADHIEPTTWGGVKEHYAG